MTEEISPDDAARAIDAAKQASATSAGKVVAPIWFDLALSSIIAGMVLVLALPIPFLNLAQLFLFGALGLTVWLYRRRYGVWVSGWRAGKTRLIALSLFVLYLGILGVSLYSFHVLHLFWPMLVGAGVMFILAMIGSRIWMATYRAETGTGS
ncbi:hypothetical protein [Maricaulis sp.]|uniref:hypothetical protein n=1 Tax=Maricaulis sp. TaxID=1486257 RepID=UPI003A95B57D